MRNGITTRTEWTPERLAAAGRNVAIVLGAAVVLGVFAVGANLYYVAAVIAAAVLVILVAWQFEAALVLYALVAFVPWGQTPDLAVGGSGVGKGVYVSEIMLGFLLAVWAGKYLFGVLPRNRMRTGFHVPLALYLAYCVLNVVHSHIFWDPHVNKIYQRPEVNMIDLGFRFLSAGALLMMATSITSKKWLKWTTVAIMIPGFYNLASAMLRLGRIIPLSAPWWPLVALLPICVCWGAALDSSLGLTKRIAGAVVTGVAFFVVLVRGISWISGWVGLIAAVGTVAFIKNKRVFALIAAGALVVGFAFWPFWHEHVLVASEQEGDFDRFALLSGAWKYATTFPLGVGLGNYRTYNSFHYGVEWGTTAYTSAHGAYAQHLAETGIPGLVLFVGVLIGGLVWMRKSYEQMPAGSSKAYLLASMGQLVGIACAAFIGDYIIPAYHNGGLVTFSATVYSWLIWGLAVAHVRLSKTGDDGSLHIDS